MPEYRNSLSVNINHLTATERPVPISTSLIHSPQCPANLPLAPLIIPNRLKL